MNPPEVMTAEEAATYLQMSRSSIYKMVQNREIPYAKLGASLRFYKPILDQWLRARTLHPHQSLLEEFELLYERFHLKKFLRAKGIEYHELDESELTELLQRAIAELKASEAGRLSGDAEE